MIDHANELRRYSRKIGHPAGDVPSVMLAAADEIERLAAMLEEAESEAIEQARLNGMGSERELALIAKLEAAEKERDAAELMSLALQAKIEQMERQEPVAKVESWTNGSYTRHYKLKWLRDVDEGAALYALPGAQLAPSVPDGWLRAIDEALVTAHIGIANAHDTYEQAKAKLDNLIGLHTDVATDPAVNGGWKLVPIEPTPEMLRALIDGANQYDSWHEGYRAMLAAVPAADTNEPAADTTEPEAKP